LRVLLRSNALLQKPSRRDRAAIAARPIYLLLMLGDGPPLLYSAALTYVNTSMIYVNNLW